MRLARARSTLRSGLRPLVTLVRDAVGTSSIDMRLGSIEERLHALAPGETSPLDVNLLLHQSRGALMREMPAGAQTILSAGCAGRWYFDWVEQTYGPVAHHLGIEFYAPEPPDLPPHATWIANTAGNMEAVEDDACDLVIAGQSIEHLWPDEVAGFLLEAARVTRPGGHLVVDSPNRELTSLLEWSHPEHTIELTVPEITSLVELAGFDVTTVAGIWLCRDPRTGRVLPFEPEAERTDWSPVERLVAARSDPRNSFLWWLEGRRADRTPRADDVRHEIARIFAAAWPERIGRTKVGAGRRVIERDGEQWIVVPPRSPGAVLFGPYMPLPAGRHRVTFVFEADPEARGVLAVCDVAAGMEGVSIATVEVAAGTVRPSIEVSLEELVFGAQFRCTSAGNAGFMVRRQIVLDEAPV